MIHSPQPIILPILLGLVLLTANYISLYCVLQMFEPTKVEKVLREFSGTEQPDPNQYPVYPDDDGTDRPRNPYSPV